MILRTRILILNVGRRTIPQRARQPAAQAGRISRIANRSIATDVTINAAGNTATVCIGAELPSSIMQ